MVDVVNNGYWHARIQVFLAGSLIKFIEWARIAPDLIFGIAGVAPMVIAVLLTYLTLRKKSMEA